MKVGVLFLFLFYFATSFGCVEKISPIVALENNLNIHMHSSEYLRYIRKKMTAFIADHRKGYITFDTEKIFPSNLVKKVFKSFPYPCDLMLEGIGYDGGSKCPENTDTKAIRRIINTYTTWITDLFNELSPKEKIYIKNSELRLITPQNGTMEPAWHNDGGYLALGLALLGRGTQYLENSPLLKDRKEEAKFIATIQEKEIKEVATGNTMLFTAVERTMCNPTIASTIHRSPPPTPGKRIFLIVRYYKK